MRWIAAVAVCLVVSATAWADWGARRDPFDPGVVRRYKEILAKDPHDEGALRQLVTLYKRYRTVDKLEAEYRKQLDAGEDWATLVVLARMPRSSHGEVLALWKRALAAKPDDPLGWIAAGDATATDAGAARDAYEHAVKLLTAPRQKKVALTKLIAAARIAGDANTVDNGYAQLLQLSPKDGTLWLDRGNAQLAAKKAADAKESFITAESLLRTDPERQLTAMMNQGVALEALGQPGDAIAQYEHTLDKTPRGYFLAAQLVSMIVDAERKRGQVAAAIGRLEKRWPETSRGYSEWATLGDLYKETGDTDRAIAAYKRAVAKAPTEVTTQRKLIVLLDKERPSEALAQHESAARYAPGDADLQLELAKRYHPDEDAKAFAVLEALARRMSKNINVRATIAALYEQWNELPRAIVEYEAIATVEPGDPEHAIVLGDAYWRADNQPKARAAWQRLEKLATPNALYRLGEVLAMHELWDDAIAAYTKSIALDGASSDTLYGRARAHDALARFSLAIEDARRAVALTGYATQADGLRNRQLLVRVLAHAYAQGDHKGLATAVATWRFAFDHGDAAAGYLLAAHHSRLGSYQQHDVLVKLYRLVPTDDSLGITVARSYVHRREFERARHELAQIAHRNPARGEEIAGLIAQVDSEQARAEREIRLEEEGRARTAGDTDLVGRGHRWGTRLELGGDVHNAGGALLGFGLYRSSHVAHATSMMYRFDWMQRDSQMEEIDEFSFGVGVTTRLVDARKFELAVGAGPRLELRYGSDAAMSPWSRGGLAADFTVEVLPRALPVTLGVRLDQNLTDDARSSALLLELGVEVR